MKKLSNILKKWLYKNRIEIILFLLIISVYGYFFSCGSANQNARYDVIFAFVEPQTNDFMTFRIDRFIIAPEKGINTCDWSFYNGHFYSNKAPGTALLGIPVYGLIFGIEKISGIPWQHPYIEILNAYLINFFVSVLPMSIGIFIFYRLLVLKGISLNRAFIFALILAFSTCTFPYSTQLWGHTTAMAFIIFAIYNLEQGKNYNYVLSGLFLGFATLTDYLSIFITIITGLYIILKNWRKIPYYISGGILPLIMMFAYHYICFGHIFNTPTSFTNPIYLDNDKWLGLFSNFSFSIFLRLLFSLERGILIAMPILLFAIPGLYFKIKKERYSSLFSIYSIITILTILIVNSSFNGWHGGHSTCARYQIITLPFWCLLISGIPKGKKWKIPLLITAFISAFNMLTVTTVCIQTFEKNPIYKKAYSNFFKGNFHILNYPIRLQVLHPDWNKFADITSTNMGELLGFQGLFSLIPLLMLIVIILLPIRDFLFKAPIQSENKSGI